MGMFKIYSFSNFHIYDTVLLTTILWLTIINYNLIVVLICTSLMMESPCCTLHPIIYLITGSLYLLTLFTHFPHPLWQTLTCSINLVFCLRITWRSSNICLAVSYFTYHNTLKVNPCCHKLQDFIFYFYDWIFPCVYIPFPLSIHPWLRLGFCPYLGYCK